MVNVVLLNTCPSVLAVISGKARYDGGSTVNTLVRRDSNAALGSKTIDRLHSELEALTPGETGVTPPGPERAAKGVAGYALFVAMIAVNFALLGIVPA